MATRVENNAGVRLPRLPTFGLVLGAYLVLTLLLEGPHLFPLTQVSQETFDHLDAYISMWSMWWTRHSVLQLDNPFWTDAVFYPRGTSLAFHSYPFVYALASIPLQLALPGSEGLAIAYNLTIFSSFVLAGFGAYLLALRVTSSHAGAFVAGTIFSFAPFHILNSNRLAVCGIEVLPFYVLALLRLGERPSRARAVQLAGALACAYYNSVEYALYLVFFSLLWFAWVLVDKGRAALRALWRPLLLASVTFSVVAAPLLSQQLDTAHHEAGSVGGKLSDAVFWSPAVLSFFTPSRTHPAYGQAWAFAGEFRDGFTHGMRSETSVGWFTWALVVLSLWRTRRGERALWALGALMFFVLGLGPLLKISGDAATAFVLPYRALYEWLPAMQAVKEPTRMFPLLLLMLALLAAFAVRDLLSASDAAPPVRRALVALIVFAVGFEDLTAWPWATTRHESVRVAPFYQTLTTAPRDTVVMDLSASDATLRAQPVHEKRTVEWQGFVPRAGAAREASPLFELGGLLRGSGPLPSEFASSRPEALRRYRRALEQAHVRYLLLAPRESMQPAWTAIVRALGGELRFDGGLFVAEFRAQ